MRKYPCCPTWKDQQTQGGENHNRIHHSRYHHAAVFPIPPFSAENGAAIKSALNELDAAGLLVRERRGFSAPNRLYVKVPQIPLVQFSDHMAAIQPEKRPISGEAESIGNAMRMRGITGKKLFKNPQAVLEYRIVPFMMSVVTIGKDLSAVALTRGLGNGTKRTSICKIGFHWKDFALMLVVTVALLVFLFFSGGLK